MNSSATHLTETEGHGRAKDFHNLHPNCERSGLKIKPAALSMEVLEVTITGTLPFRIRIHNEKGTLAMGVMLNRATSFVLYLFARDSGNDSKVCRPVLVFC